MSLSIQTEGRRHYIGGNTYPVRDRIKSLGAHWDGAKKMWWTGKRDEAEALVAALNGEQGQAQAQERADGLALDAKVIRGRGEYKGKTYYVLAAGEKDGRPYAKLASRDGKLVFWASKENIGTFRLLKEYREPVSIQWLRDYADKRKQEQSGERACPACERYCTCGTGQFCTHHHDGCERCGEER